VVEKMSNVVESERLFENGEHSTNVVDEMSKVVDNGGSWSQFVEYGSEVVEEMSKVVENWKTITFYASRFESH